MNEERISVLSENMLPEQQEVNYHLVCNVKIVEQTLRNTNAKGIVESYESKWVILEPETNDQFVLFLQAYFPDDIIDSDCEVVFIHKRRGFTFRACVSRADKNSQRIHLKMMSMDFEDHFKEGERIEIKSITPDEEEKLKDI